MSLHPNGMIFMATPTGVLTIAQSALATKRFRRRVPIGDTGGASETTMTDLTNERDGRTLVIRGARHASVPNAFARIWLTDPPMQVPWGFGLSTDKQRKVTAATVRAYVRVTHSSSVTQRLHSNTAGFSLLDTRTLSPGWNLFVARFEGEAARDLVAGSGRSSNVVLTWEGSGDISQSSVEIDLFEVGHEYGFWPELAHP
jgi:hypothetical protein